ncbi:MAG: LCP family protein [Eubacterium sp.]|nr:LCP family protein [Eubacterium sp.]
MDTRRRNVTSNHRDGRNASRNGQRVSAAQKQRSRQAQSRPRQRSDAYQEELFRQERPSPRGSAPQNRPLSRKKKRKKPLWKRIVKLLIVLLLIAAAFTFYNVKFANLNRDLSGRASLYNISDSAAQMAKNHRIVNVAIFGVDGRDDVEGNRSDSIMIASADFEHGAIKVTSLMRDSYVYINDDYDYDKLNAAYSYGGAELALKTINQNFDTAISDYVTIDFTAMVEMVNAVGGVTINIESEDELYWVNQYLMDVNDKVHTSSPDVPGTGAQLLDGSQALAYCRIRYIGNGDFDRTQRQRAVFEQVLAKAMDLNPVAQYNLLMKVLPYTETSLSTSELIKYASNAMFMSGHEIQQMQMPTDGLVDTGTLDGVSYVFPYTLAENIQAWYQFVYEESYTPSDTAQGISDEIESVWW